MRWLLFTRKQESKSAQQFDSLLDEVIDEFEEAVKTHIKRLEQLREALRDS